jgi:hypothetical protein
MAMQSGKSTFNLTLNLMVKNLLISSLGMCKFILLHEKHPYAQAIKQFKLFDSDELERFIEVVRKGQPGQTLLLDIRDELLIYTAMDITCKAYLTDLGDEMERINAAALKETKSSFADIRNTLLKGCSLVMGGMKEALAGNKEFEERVDILDNYILAG